MYLHDLNFHMAAVRVKHPTRFLLVALVCQPCAWSRGFEDWEPEEEAYFGRAVAEFVPGNLSREEFDARIRAGRPFVVRGAGIGHPMESWDCNFFRSDVSFGDVEVKKEYSRGTVPAKKWIKIREVGVSTPKADGTNQIAPYYFGIKEAVSMSPEEMARDPDASKTWTKRVLKKVQTATVAFPFMDSRNVEIMRATPEIWFSTATSSARAHVDQHTESTVSLQLFGQKRWRLSLMGKRRHPHVMRLYADGQLYDRSENTSWQILDDVTLGPGDAVFFGPGFIHETKNLHPADVPGQDTCAVSITYQFDVPQATGLFRDFLPRFRWTPDLSNSRRIVDSWVRKGASLLKSDAHDLTRALRERARGASEDFVAFFDLNADGQVTSQEADAVVSVWRTAEKTVRSKIPKILRNQGFGYDNSAEHDADYPAKLKNIIDSFEDVALSADLATHRAEL